MVYGKGFRVKGGAEGLGFRDFPKSRKMKSWKREKIGHQLVIIEKDVMVFLTIDT
jgi:hypothetical protein